MFALEECHWVSMVHPLGPMNICETFPDPANSCWDILSEWQFLHHKNDTSSSLFEIFYILNLQV